MSYGNKPFWEEPQQSQQQRNAGAYWKGSWRKNGGKEHATSHGKVGNSKRNHIESYHNNGNYGKQHWNNIPNSNYQHHIHDGCNGTPPPQTFCDFNNMTSYMGHGGWQNMVSSDEVSANGWLPQETNFYRAQPNLTQSQPDSRPVSQM